MYGLYSTVVSYYPSRFKLKNRSLTLKRIIFCVLVFTGILWKINKCSLCLVPARTWDWD